MAGSTRGSRFVVTTFGESHGGGVGVVVDGCPAGLSFPYERVQAQLARRRPGQSRLSTQRKEPDEVEVLSGVDPSSRQTLGTPIAMLVRNKDARTDHYDDMAQLYRPSHADYTYDARFGIRAVGGGGRASARETIGRVAAGAVAEALLDATHGVSIVAWVEQVADVRVEPGAIDEGTIDREGVDTNDVRCPHQATAAAMEQRILDARKEGDSVGGVLRCVVRGVPSGWGEPVFDKLTADLAGALMSLPATRAIAFGEGFGAVDMRGSEHNDPFVMKADRIGTSTNNSGGIQGGISNGEPIRIALAFKPVATIFREQETVTRDGRPTTFKPAKGRHDPCVLPRAVPMVEGMVALVLADHLLRRAGARLEDLQP